MALSHPVSESATHRISSPCFVAAVTEPTEVKEKLGAPETKKAKTLTPAPEPAPDIPQGRLYKLGRKGWFREMEIRSFRFEGRALVYYKKEDFSDRKPKRIDLLGCECMPWDDRRWPKALIIRISKPAKRRIGIVPSPTRDNEAERQRWVKAINNCAKGRLWPQKE
jgi:hypothetical protein